MTISNANPLPALNVDQAYRVWRHTIGEPLDLGELIAPETDTYLRAFAAGYNACLSALAEAGLISHGTVPEEAGHRG